jgi:hypothetical protein
MTYERYSLSLKPTLAVRGCFPSVTEIVLKMR